MIGLQALRRRINSQARRYREIIGILVKYGFSEIAASIGSAFRQRFKYKVFGKTDRKRLKHVSRWGKVRLAIEELGPTFVKFGQLMSSRRDVLPEDLIEELERLQDKVPPFPTKQAVEIIRKELGRPLKKIFSSFEKKPIAAASIAQVHRAVLLTGERVAVKIRRPEIVDTIRADLDIMYTLATFLENRFHRMRVFRLRELINEFENQLNRELNLSHELINIEKFRNAFSGNSKVYVPSVYREYSTEKVLTMEYVRGKKISKIVDASEEEYDKRLIATTAAEIILEQIFIHGFFHADPHPGNITILDNNVFCFLDFGLMGSILPDQQDLLNTMMLGMVNKDSTVITRAVLRLARAESFSNREGLESAIYKYMDQYLELPLEELEINKALRDLINIIAEFEIKLPLNLTLMVKSLIIMEAIGKQLDPEFKTIKILKSFAPRIIRWKLNGDRIARKLYHAGLEYGEIFRELPLDIRDVFKIVKNQELKFNFELAGMESLREILDKTGFRLVFGLVLSALLVSSSLIVQANIEPKWQGIPLIGLIGFLVGGVMGISFLVSGFIGMLRWRGRKEKKE